MAEPNANDYMIGGDHYRRVPGEQLWDRIVRLYGIERARVFFIGSILGYVERYEHKEGLRDLEKAQHYIAKLIELEKTAGLIKGTLPEKSCKEITEALSIQYHTSSKSLSEGNPDA